MSQSEDEAIKKMLFRVGSEITSIARDNAPYVSGNLHDDIQVFDENLDNLEIEIGNSKLAPYAPFVHEGTGIYGKKKRKITPTKKKALKTPFGVFKSVKGQKAQPYLTDAMKEYVDKGGVDRLMSDTGDEISENIFENMKSSLKNIEIK